MWDKPLRASSLDSRGDWVAAQAWDNHSIWDVVTGPEGYLYLCTNNRDGRGSPVATDDRIVRLVPET